jgi:hypothetical protein
MQIYNIEIKNRFFLIFLSQTFSLLSLYHYKSILLFILVYPILKLKSSVNYFIVNDVMELFHIYFHILLFFSNQLFLIIFFYHFLVFIFYACYKPEFKNLIFVCRTIFCSWVLSIYATHLFLIPTTWFFFLEFHTSEFDFSPNIYFEPKLIDYFNFYVTFYWVNFWYFQFTGILFFLLSAPKVTILIIKKYRKIFHFCFFTSATIVCPDIFSLLFFVVILLLTFELSFLLKLIML